MVEDVAAARESRAKSHYGFQRVGPAGLTIRTVWAVRKASIRSVKRRLLRTARQLSIPPVIIWMLTDTNSSSKRVICVDEAVKNSEVHLCRYASFFKRAINMASFFILCEKYSFFKYVICKSLCISSLLKALNCGQNFFSLLRSLRVALMMMITIIIIIIRMMISHKLKVTLYIII